MNHAPFYRSAELVAGSHLIMISQPQAVTDVILSAVGQATAVNVGQAA